MFVSFTETVPEKDDVETRAIISGRKSILYRIIPGKDKFLQRINPAKDNSCKE